MVIGHWRYSAEHSESWNFMEIISQMHLPAALPLGGPQSRSGGEEE